MTNHQGHCPLCGAARTAVYRDIRDFEFGGGRVWSILSCEACGLSWLEPRPRPEAISESYGEGYYTHAPWRAALSGCFRHLKRLPPGRVLDVGCGNGSDMAGLRDLGWQVDGVDPDPNAAAVARVLHDLRISTGTLENAGFPADTFDAVVLSHSIEHASDPDELLSECRRVLKPGGRLLVATPNWRSAGHRIFKNSWYPLEPPRHLFIFTTTSLERLAKDAGFEVAELRTTSHWAGAIFANSRVIRRLGALPPGTARGTAAAKLADAILGLAFKAGEAAACRLPPFRELGEELELVARKPAQKKSFPSR